MLWGFSPRTHGIQRIRLSVICSLNYPWYWLFLERKLSISSGQLCSCPIDWRLLASSGPAIDCAEGRPSLRQRCVFLSGWRLCVTFRGKYYLNMLVCIFIMIVILRIINFFLYMVFLIKRLFLFIFQLFYSIAWNQRYSELWFCIGSPGTIVG